MTCISCSAKKDIVPIAVISGIAAFSIGLISMFVCGILGAQGKLSMAPWGARVMVVLPVAFIVTVIGAVVENAAKS